MADAWTLLQARRRTGGGLPLVTYVDPRRAERTELSATSLENGAAKIANALRDEFDLDTGSTVGLHLPRHWQRSAWCAGTWTAGCVVAVDADPADVDLVVAGPAEAVSLVGRARSDVAVVSLHPLGLPITEPLPPGALDVTVAVRQQPDAYLSDPPSGDDAAWRTSDGSVLSQDDVLHLAADRARAWGLAAGGRLLVDDRVDEDDAWLACLAVPLAAGAAVVLVRGEDGLAGIAERERVTTWARPPR